MSYIKNTNIKNGVKEVKTEHFKKSRHSRMA